jgi:hypothetical protein
VCRCAQSACTLLVRRRALRLLWGEQTGGYMKRAVGLRRQYAAEQSPPAPVLTGSARQGDPFLQHRLLLPVASPEGRTLEAAKLRDRRVRHVEDAV